MFQIKWTTSGKAYLLKVKNNYKKIVHCQFTNRIFDFFTPKDIMLATFQQVFGDTDLLKDVTFGWTFPHQKTLFILQSSLLQVNGQYVTANM